MKSKSNFGHPVQLDCEIVGGEPFSETIHWMQEGGEVPEDVTGFAAALGVEDQSGVTVILTEKDGLAIGGEDGRITISLTAEQTASLAALFPITAQVSIIGTAPDGRRHRIMSGDWTILPGEASE